MAKRIALLILALFCLSACAVSGSQHRSQNEGLFGCRPGSALKYRIPQGWPADRVWHGGSCAYHQ